MKPGKLFSVVFLALFMGFGGLIGYRLVPMWSAAAGGAALAMVLGGALHHLTGRCLRKDVFHVLGGAAGMLMGILAGTALAAPLSHLIPEPVSADALSALIIMGGTLMGMEIGASTSVELRRKIASSPEPHRTVIGVLDTSVIIDGRIADVCETGFLSGDLIIPLFVLKELQAIADSSESTKRTRGRRGLDILNKIQKQSYVTVIIEERDYPAVKEVDQKLIHLAKELGCPIITNDFNLNKVAEVHAIQALNINQLANALKPIVLPGENIRVHIMKEGKEQGQGVAYLDDGTMVVVDGGRRHMGRTVEVIVTSVLQTTAGRMIFATVK